jgi:EmrB/QacA subfamily drug resistance transporter
MTNIGPEQRNRWQILAVLCIAQLMVILDGTLVNIALPSAQRELGFSSGDRQWIVTGYAVAFGSLLLLGGRLSDLFGRKSMLVIGLCGFAGASAIGGASQSFLMLAVARAVQGGFGALLAPASLAELNVTFTDPADRNRAFGIFGGIIATGASIGLILGGALTQWIDWRAVMYVNIFIAVIAVTGVLKLLVNQRPEEKPYIDFAGAVTGTAGLFAIVFGLSHAEGSSWSDPFTLGWTVAGAVLLALFVVIEARVVHALLPLRVLADRNRGASLLTISMAAMAMFSMFLFLTFHLQAIKGYSPIQTGAAFLPMSLALLASSSSAPTLLSSRLGPRWMMAGGMALGAVGMVYLTRLDVSATYWAGILPALLLLGLGLGLVFSTATNNAVVGVQLSDTGVASAIANAAPQIGGSVGTALLSTIAVSATASYQRGLTITPLVIAQAGVHGYTTAWTWSAAIFAAGAVVALVMYKDGLHGDPCSAAKEVAAERARTRQQLATSTAIAPSTEAT